MLRFVFLWLSASFTHRPLPALYGRCEVKTQPTPSLKQSSPVQSGPNLDPLLRLPAVISASGLQRSTIYERMAKGTFPKNINLGGRAVAWRQSAIRAWVESLEAAQ